MHVKLQLVSATAFDWKAVQSLVNPELIREMDKEGSANKATGYLRLLQSLMSRDLTKINSQVLKTLHYSFMFQMPPELLVSVLQQTNLLAISKAGYHYEIGLLHGTLSDWYDAVNTDFEDIEMRKLFNQVFILFIKTDVAQAFNALSRTELPDGTFKCSPK